MTTVYLSHGLESGPGAMKMQAMKEVVEALDGCEAVVMDYRGMSSPSERLQHLLATLEQRHADPMQCIMAGSSLGGWVSAAASARHPLLGCFLLAPALGLDRYPESSPVIQAKHTRIIHGWNDDIVPPGPIIDYAQAYCFPLRLLNDDHRLHASLDTILDDFRRFLETCLEPAASEK
ncbi:alpha/beta hydrolase [Halomonas sediminis]